MLIITGDIIAQQLKITGIVQGVGFRPFIFRLANKYKLVGSIKNHGSHVLVFVQGDKKMLQILSLQYRNKSQYWQK